MEPTVAKTPTSRALPHEGQVPFGAASDLTPKLSSGPFFAPLKGHALSQHPEYSATPWQDNKHLEDRTASGFCRLRGARTIARAHGRAPPQREHRALPGNALRLCEESSRAALSAWKTEAPAASPRLTRGRQTCPLHPTCLAAGRLLPPPRLKLQPPEPHSPPQGNAESGFRDVARVTRAPPPRRCVYPASASEASQSRCQ